MVHHNASVPDKIILVIIDGIGDVSIPSFGDRTPLQVAHTPNMDCIAAAGLNGIVDAVEPGLACGSDTSHMNLLGYDPRKYYHGRGAFESMGAGLPMAPGDIAFKSNFATYNPATGIVEKRRADRQFEHLGPTLCGALDGLKLPSFPQHQISVRYATEHRCGVVVRGPGLTDAVSGTDPLKDNLPLLTAQPLDDTFEAQHTAAVVNELNIEIQHILGAHPINKQRVAEGKNPANVVLLRGCGSRINVPSFEKLHGMRACIVAPTKIIAGLGMSFDIVSLDAPGATGSYDSHFASKAAVACDALISRGFDFALVHVKAVDDTGHDRLLAMKVKFLEVIDRMIGHILVRLHDTEQLHYQLHQAERQAWQDRLVLEQPEQQQQQEQPDSTQRYAICITGDHSTPVVFGDHSHEPVPIALARVCHAVAAMGGGEQVQLRRQFMDTDCERIALPDVKQPPPPLPDLLQQAQQQQNRQAAAAAQQGPRSAVAVPCDADGSVQGTEQQQQSQQQQWVQKGQQNSEGSVASRNTEPAAAATAGRIGGSSSGSSNVGFGHWLETWPQLVLGDSVTAFDELSAAHGSLGRFTGAGVMPLLREFARRNNGVF